MEGLGAILPDEDNAETNAFKRLCDLLCARFRKYAYFEWDFLRQLL